MYFTLLRSVIRYTNSTGIVYKWFLQFYLQKSLIKIVEVIFQIKIVLGILYKISALNSYR
jgi:hypothetical protein